VSRYVALFTGQGSQFAGMGRALASSSPEARAVFEEAEAVLPGILGLCFEGPEERLVLTENTQPCVLAVDIAAYRAFGREPAIAAGHSLGEYAALVAAESLEFATALRLVRKRARAMQEAVPAGRGGMVVLRKVGLEEARKLAAGIGSGVCDLANLNAPGQIVLSGEAAAMDEVVERLGPRKALRLPVSVPFHSSLLAEAGQAFARELDATEFADPAFPIVCNVDARPLSKAAEIREALKRQFAGSVLWQESIEVLCRDGFEDFVEFGPKPTLSRMATQIARALGVEIRSRAVCGPEDLGVPAEG